MARLIVVSLLIVSLLVAASPQAREEMGQAWETARPTVVALMDGVYAVVRTLIAGDGRNDRIDSDPVVPDANFERIVTMSKEGPL